MEEAEEAAKADPVDPVQAVRQMEMLWAESIMSGLEKLRDKAAHGRRNITNNTPLISSLV